MWLHIADLEQSDFAEVKKSEPNVICFEEDPRTSSLNAGWDWRIYRAAELCESRQMSSEDPELVSRKKGIYNWIKCCVCNTNGIDLIQLVFNRNKKKKAFWHFDRTWVLMRQWAIGCGMVSLRYAY